MRKWLAIAFLLLAGPALAQAPDPRLAVPTINALQAMLVLREAQLRIAQEKIAELEKQSKPVEDK